MEEGLFVPIFSVGCTSHSPASSSPAGGAENLPPHEACGGKFRLSACPHPNVLRQEVHPCRQLLVPAQDVVLGRGTTPPRTPTAPLGGGEEAATQWAACCPPAGAQVTGDSNLLCMLSGAHTCRKSCGARGWAGRAGMHGADAPAHAANVRCVRDRPCDRRARCLRATASSLCIGCRCDVL